MSNFQCDVVLQQCWRTKSHRKSELDIQIHIKICYSSISSSISIICWGLLRQLRFTSVYLSMLIVIIIIIIIIIIIVIIAGACFGYHISLLELASAVIAQ